jgi:hypothetical protein
LWPVALVVVTFMVAVLQPVQIRIHRVWAAILSLFNRRRSFLDAWSKTEDARSDWRCSMQRKAVVGRALVAIGLISALYGSGLDSMLFATDEVPDLPDPWNPDSPPTGTPTSSTLHQTHYDCNITGACPFWQQNHCSEPIGNCVRCNKPYTIKTCVYNQFIMNDCTEDSYANGCGSMEYATCSAEKKCENFASGAGSCGTRRWCT